MKWVYFTLVAFCAQPAIAQSFTALSDETAFLERVNGKTLSNRFYGVDISVHADGTLSGTGLAWGVSGTWDWQDGYFCRAMTWGGDPIPYNCQLVEIAGERVRFTSDFGAGDSATFKLR
jgi:hypothetical protein